MKNRFIFVLGLLSIPASTTLANELSPYTPVKGGSEVELSVSRQSADTFNPGKARAALPVDLRQTSIVMDASYGLTDKLSVDFRLGYAKSKFAVDPVLAPQGGLDGLNDVVIGLRYKLVDEVDGGPLTATLGASAIIDGGYRTGAITAVGDGGSGGQVVLAIGRQFGAISLTSNLGYRARSNNIPDELFGGTQLGITFADRISIFGSLSFTDSSNGLEIGGPGFSPARFPEVEEDYKVWSIGSAISLTENVALNASFGQKFDGRNTARSNFFRIGLGFSF
jgi:hypothetical protein